MDEQQARLEKSTMRACDAIVNMANRSANREKIADREAQEAMNALMALEWYGNFGEPIQRVIEDAMERLAEHSHYESAEELREAANR